uniref:B3 domain-containing protein LOC_Os12g40080-like isoform X1 n=1 Tax=Cicer arietinum TaxID=3827 RepID=A0A1S2Y2B9_CICAR|nr:B3 domain-containing protein LOC_Os12g40080-like isoform X1 [Cicer arietinum]
MSSQQFDHGVHFFKVILQKSIQEGKLKVPQSFVMKHWQGITNPITLRLPNMTQWEVLWEKTCDYDVCFCKGWKEFANYLSLSDSQFVVFKYQENSHFNVIVFDKCGLEITYPLRETSEKCEDVDESDYSLEIIEDPSSSRRKRPKSPSSSSKIYKKVKIISKEQKECKHEKSKVLAHARFYNSKHMDMVAGSSCDNILKRSRILHEKVKNEFSCEKDFFICVIHKTYIERDLLVIPRDFSKIHLHRMEGRNATIFVDQNRTWNVDLKLTRNDQFTLSGGWNKFRHHNNVKYGDVCVFILNKIKGTVSFQVVIFSLEKEITTPYFE